MKNNNLKEQLVELINKYRIQKGNYFLLESNIEGVEKLHICQMLSGKDKLSITDNNILKSDAIDLVSSIDANIERFKKSFDIFGRRNPEVLLEEDTALKSSVIYNTDSKPEQIKITRVILLSEAQEKLAQSTFNKIRQDQESKNTKTNKISIKLPM